MCRPLSLSARPALARRLVLPLCAAIMVAVLSAPTLRAQQKPQGGGMLAVPATPRATPPPPPADTRFQAARVVNHPAPAYPTLAQLNRVEGVVTVRFGINDQGHVTALAVAKSGGSIMLDSVVRDPTLQAWTFQPATLDGKAIASSVERELEFRLDPEEQRKLARQRLALTDGFPDPPYPPEAVALHERNPASAPLRGSCTVGVTWTERGLVDLIYLDKTSGSDLLNRAALRWAFGHWRIDPRSIVYPKDKDGKEKPFLKTVTFTPPPGS